MRGAARARVARPAAARLGAAGVAAYLAALAAIQLSRSLEGVPRAAALASSPAGVARGHVWRLLTSGLVVEGLPWLQLAGLALLLAYGLRALGGGRLWTAIAVAHVGSALLAYAGIGVLWLAGAGWIDGVLHRPDYGVSCVAAGVLGALCADAAGRDDRRALAATGAVTLAALAVAIPDAGALANAEHVLAFALGAFAARRRG